MSRVVFMCGPAGSGKSRYAMQLAEQGFVRLSIDVEAWQRGFRRMPIPDDVERAIEEELWRRLVTLVGTGRDVVLDFSLWSRQMRDQWRAAVAPTGIVPEIVYVVTDRQTSCERAATRTNGPDGFSLTRELAQRYFEGFEPPEPDEGATVIDGLSP